jgi:4-carboxymuconolactone decarboxylase
MSHGGTPMYASSKRGSAGVVMGRHPSPSLGTLHRLRRYGGSTPITGGSMHDDRYERGRERFLEVHDEKALAAVEGLGDLGRLIVETVYGDVYTRPGLSTRDRELAAVVALVSLGRSAQIPQHLRAALKAGLTAEELQEAILQTATIAGFPPAMNAMSTLKTIAREQESG